MRKSTIFLLGILIFACLSGCSARTNAQEPPASPTTEPNAIEALDEDEKAVYAALLNSISIFHSPADVRILEMGDFASEGPTDYPYRKVILKLSGVTLGGGKTTEYYCLIIDYDNFQEMWGEMVNQLFEAEKTEAIEEKWPDDRIAKMNKALAQHWEDLGL